jgi:MFS family permease
MHRLYRLPVVSLQRLSISIGRRTRVVSQTLRLLSNNSVENSKTKLPCADPALQLVSSREPGKVTLFRLLKLSEFSHEELEAAHLVVLAANAQEVDEKKDSSSETYRLAKKLGLIIEDSSSNQHQVLPLNEFSELVRKEGEALDIRVWPIALSFAATGLSIGIIIPILPILVKEIHLPNSIFGLAVASFGLAKLIGNIPTATWVEEYGRKPVMVGGMAVCALGLGTIGFSLNPELGAPWLIGCRFVTGLGVAAFTSGAFMYMSDISTSLNRTRTMAPVMSGFQAGTAIGPALGGVAVIQLGIVNSYITVGTSIAVLAVLNSIFLNESRVQPIALPAKSVQSIVMDSDGDSINTTGASEKPKGSFAVARSEWSKLLKTKEIRDVVFLNLAYWLALSGTQFTLLPLFMVAEPLSLDPGHLGIFFSSLSVVSVATAQPAAWLADKYGKVPGLLAGTSLLSLSFATIPLATSFEGLMLAGLPLALGGTVLSSVPTAHMSDLTTNEQRAQALALLRTAGDVGLLVGAMGSGLASEMMGIGNTMQFNAALLGGALSWFGARHYADKLTSKKE